jgi:hypothetical protein
MAEMLQFHVQVYARPAGATPGRPQLLDGCQVTPLVASQAELLSAWPITFDEAAAALAQLPRMFIEPDGSFVWVSPEGESAWQVDGVLYDRGERLAYAELKGCCAPRPFDELLAALGWPRTALAFSLVPHGVVLGEKDFCRVAAGLS